MNIAQTKSDTLKFSAKMCRMQALGLLLGCSFISGPLLAANSVYKYQEGGSVTYQDRPPSSVQDNGHSVLNENGVTLRNVPGRDERLRLRAQQEAERRQQIRDRALLATFSTEADLIRTRDDRIGMIDGLINRLDDRIRILSERLSTIDSRIDAKEDAGASALDSLYDERQSILRNIENAWSLVDAKAAERTSLIGKFKDDLERYRQLKQARGAPGNF